MPENQQERVRVKAPDGRIGTIPKTNLERALERGFTLVPTTEEERVSVIAPDGRKGTIPRKNLGSALQRGFRLLKTTTSPPPTAAISTVPAGPATAAQQAVTTAGVTPTTPSLPREMTTAAKVSTTAVAPKPYTGAPIVGGAPVLPGIEVQAPAYTPEEMAKVPLPQTPQEIQTAKEQLAKIPVPRTIPTPKEMAEGSRQIEAIAGGFYDLVPGANIVKSVVPTFERARVAFNRGDHAGAAADAVLALGQIAMSVGSPLLGVISQTIPYTKMTGEAVGKALGDEKSAEILAQISEKAPYLAFGLAGVAAIGGSAALGTALQKIAEKAKLSPEAQERWGDIGQWLGLVVPLGGAKVAKTFRLRKAEKDYLKLLPQIREEIAKKQTTPGVTTTETLPPETKTATPITSTAEATTTPTIPFAESTTAVPSAKPTPEAKTPGTEKPDLNSIFKKMKVKHLGEDVKGNIVLRDNTTRKTITLSPEQFTADKLEAAIREARGETIPAAKAEPAKAQPETKIQAPGAELPPVEGKLAEPTPKPIEETAPEVKPEAPKLVGEEGIRTPEEMNPDFAKKVKDEFGKSFDQLSPREVRNVIYGITKKAREPKSEFEIIFDEPKLMKVVGAKSPIEFIEPRFEKLLGNGEFVSDGYYMIIDKVVADKIREKYWEKLTKTLSKQGSSSQEIQSEINKIKETIERDQPDFQRVIPRVNYNETEPLEFIGVKTGEPPSAVYSNGKRHIVLDAEYVKMIKSYLPNTEMRIEKGATENSPIIFYDAHKNIKALLMQRRSEIYDLPLTKQAVRTAETRPEVRKEVKPPILEVKTQAPVAKRVREVATKGEPPTETPKPAGGTGVAIPPELEPLAEEARKYKDVDYFLIGMARSEEKTNAILKYYDTTKLNEIDKEWEKLVEKIKEKEPYWYEGIEDDELRKQYLDLERKYYDEEGRILTDFYNRVTKGVPVKPEASQPAAEAVKPEAKLTPSRESVELKVGDKVVWKDNPSITGVIERDREGKLFVRSEGKYMSLSPSWIKPVEEGKPEIKPTEAMAIPKETAPPISEKVAPKETKPKAKPTVTKPGPSPVPQAEKAPTPIPPVSQTPTLSWGETTRMGVPATETPSPSTQGIPPEGAAPPRGTVPPSVPPAGTTPPPEPPSSAKPLSVRDFLAESKKQVEYSGDLQQDYYKLKNKEEIDRIQSIQVVKAARGTPADYEAIYHHIENPNEPLTPQQQEILNTEILPLRNEANQLYAKLMNEGVPVEDEGYIHRIPAGRGGVIERMQAGYRRITEGGLLRKTWVGLKHRTMMAIEDEAGNRRVVSTKGGRVIAFDKGKAEYLGNLKLKDYQDFVNKEIKPLQEQLNKLQREKDILTATKGRTEASQVRLRNIDKEMVELTNRIANIEDKYNTGLSGKVFVDSKGKAWKITNATTKEIEANTSVRYYKNALASELIRYNNLKKVERSIEYLENLKNNPQFQRVAIKIGTQNIPEGYRTTDVPQLRGYVFPKRIAEVFDDFYRKRSEYGLGEAYGRINKILRDSIFFNPLIHIPNIIVHWLVHRGVTPWLNPLAYPRLIRTSIRAIRAVTTLNKDYIDVLDKGGSLMFSKTANDNLTGLLLNKMGIELNSDKALLTQISKELGYADPSRLINAVYRFSSEATWFSNDVFTLQAIFEEMEKGKTMEQAIDEVGRHIPNYRIPARVLQSRTIANLLRSDSGVTMFGAYHYGALKSYGEMLKSLERGLRGKVPASELAETIDKIAALALVTYFVYPQLDKIAQWLTSNPKAKFRRAGASTFIYNTQKFIKSTLQRGRLYAPDVATYLQTVLTPSVGFETGVELAFGRSTFTGKPIDYAETLLGAIAPIEYAQRIQSGELTPRNFLLGLVGISSPKTTPSERVLQSMIFETRPELEKQIKELYFQNKREEANKIISDFNTRILSIAEDALKEANRPEISERMIKLKLKKYFISKPTTEVMKNYKEKKQAASWLDKELKLKQ